MKTFAVLSAAALIGVGALTAPAAQARGGGALAAGLVGGLAAGALLGAAVSDAQAGYGYGDAPPPPRYGYGPAPVAVYRPAPVVRTYVDETPVYETRRVVTYARGPADYGYGGRGWQGSWQGGWQGGWHEGWHAGWRRDCDRPDRGW